MKALQSSCTSGPVSTPVAGQGTPKVGLARRAALPFDCPQGAQIKQATGSQVTKLLLSAAGSLESGESPLVILHLLLVKGRK